MTTGLMLVTSTRGVHVITEWLSVSGLVPLLSLWVWDIFLNLVLVNPWQLEYQETTFGPWDRLLYFPNHIHRVSNLEWKLKEGGVCL